MYYLVKLHTLPAVCVCECVCECATLYACLTSAHRIGQMISMYD